MIRSRQSECLDNKKTKWEIRGRTVGLIRTILNTISLDEMTPISLRATTYVSTRSGTEFLDGTKMYKI